VHTSTKSAANFEEKQAKVAAADAKKMPFDTGAWRKLNCARVRVKGAGCDTEARRVEALTNDEGGLAMTDKASSRRAPVLLAAVVI
jgi:hypothetical protein